LVEIVRFTGTWVPVAAVLSIFYLSKCFTNYLKVLPPTR
jgi:hypothetical protein